MLAWLTLLDVIIYYRKLRVLLQDILNSTQIIEQYSDVIRLNRALKQIKECNMEYELSMDPREMCTAKRKVLRMTKLGNSFLTKVILSCNAIIWMTTWQVSVNDLFLCHSSSCLRGAPLSWCSALTSSKGDHLRTEGSQAESRQVKDWGMVIRKNALKTKLTPQGDRWGILEGKHRGFGTHTWIHSPPWSVRQRQANKQPSWGSCRAAPPHPI